jgi:hypothetical protein
MSSCVVARASCWVWKLAINSNPLEIMSATALKAKNAVARIVVRLRVDLGFLVFVSILTLSYHPWVEKFANSRPVDDPG